MRFNALDRLVENAPTCRAVLSAKADDFAGRTPTRFDAMGITIPPSLLPTR